MLKVVSSSPSPKPSSALPESQLAALKPGWFQVTPGLTLVAL
jgi:hypothetical protein